MAATDQDHAIYRTARGLILRTGTATISQVADTVGASRSTVYRTAKRLGYSSWSDLVNQLRHYLPNPGGAMDQDAVLDKSVNLVVSALARNRDKTILFCAMGDATICGDYVTFRLGELGFNALKYSYEAARTHSVGDESGVAVIFNESGVSLWTSCITCARYGFETIAITADPNSPVAKAAHLSIAIKDTKTKPSAYEPNYFAAEVIAFMERVLARYRITQP
jgi:DNA-binding MurR/RpiR family transcriptional regulator